MQTKKTVTFTDPGLLRAIKDVADRERVSQTKALAYLIVMGIDRYNDVFKAGIKPPYFKMGR